MLEKEPILEIADEIRDRGAIYGGSRVLIAEILSLDKDVVAMQGFEPRTLRI